MLGFKKHIGFKNLFVISLPDDCNDSYLQSYQANLMLLIDGLKRWLVAEKKLSVLSLEKAGSGLYIEKFDLPCAYCLTLRSDKSWKRQLKYFELS